MKNFLPLLIALLLVGCTTETDSTLLEVDLNPDKLVSKEAFLNEVFEEIEYIPLETREECMIDYIRNMSLSESYALIFSNDKLLLFRRDGRFVRTIGQRGNGPDEYVFVQRTFLDDEKRRIEVFVRGAVLLYSYDGEFLEKINISNKEFALVKEKDYYIGQRSRPYYPFGEDIYSLFKYDQEYRLVDSMPTLTPREVTSGKMFIVWVLPNLVHTGERVLFREPYGDTLYSINAELQAKPFAVLNTGSLRLTEDLMYDESKKDELQNRLFIWSYYVSRKNTILTEFSVRGNRYQTFLPEGSSEVYSAEWKDAEGNTVYGYQSAHFPTLKLGFNFGEGFLFSSIQALQAREAIVPEEGLSEEMYAQIKNLDESANPVLVILK